MSSQQNPQSPGVANPQLSDSLELLHFLGQYAPNTNLIEPAIELLDAFTDKWRDGTFRVFPKVNCDEQALKDALTSALGPKVEFVEFVSVKELSRKEMKHQHRFYRIASEGNLTRQLRRANKHQNVIAKVRACHSEEHDLQGYVARSLGTRSLQPALDSTLGNSFGSIAKTDLIALWTYRIGYILLGQQEKAEELDALIALYRATPTLGRLEEKPYTWLFWEE